MKPFGILWALTIYLLEDVYGDGHCYTGAGNSPGKCLTDGKFKVSSMEECCSFANATGYAGSAWIIFPEFFKSQVSCKSCADTFSQNQSSWCFAYRNRADTTCLHSPEFSTLEAANETDCCLWLNASGYTESPQWQWSNSYSRWVTPCNSCRKNKFVVCYSELRDTTAYGRSCNQAQARMATSPQECCARPNGAGFAWINKGPLDMDCNPCPVNGGWSSWSPWSPCSATCGNSARRRVRFCINPVPKYGGSSCEGPSEEVETCKVPPKCPITAAEVEEVEGYWSDWFPTSSCNVSCGLGGFTRKRVCQRPLNKTTSGSFVYKCVGDEEDAQPCLLPGCQGTESGRSIEITDSWIWSPWTACQVTCGFGIKTRTKMCTPTFSKSNLTDNGQNQIRCDDNNDTEVAVCELQACPNTMQEQTEPVVIVAWTIAGMVGVLICLGIIVLVYRKQMRKRYPAKRRREPSGNLPPVPSSGPSLYCSMTDLRGFPSQRSHPSDGKGQEQDEDGYEIPKRTDDERDPENPNQETESALNGNRYVESDDHFGSQMAINHVYEQLDFDALYGKTFPPPVQQDARNDSTKLKDRY